LTAFGWLHEIKLDGYGCTPGSMGQMTSNAASSSAKSSPEEREPRRARA
jgi:hypothetical protein